ncbi:PBP1A family penicillin-binding protein [Candidatus Parcubacteria bacterium]|nr:PBP1A family penicillin-binding protein [Candidatus Parcubacteria bacterium]
MAERKYYRKIYQKKKNKKINLILKLLVFCFLFLGFASLLVFFYYAKDLPRPEVFTERQFIQSTKIYDRTGEVLLYDIHGEERRTIVSLNIIPKSLQQAVMAAEDARFYQHFGIDFKGVGRAILVNLQRRDVSSSVGASTITQQFIRCSFLTMEKTIERKIKELVLTIEIERRYSKDQILEWYLNQVPLGSVYGVEAASRSFFDKKVQDISLAESAIIASLIKAPSYLLENKDKLVIRKDYVLDRMVEENFITAEEAETAKKEEIKFAKAKSIQAPHFTLYIKKYLTEKYGEKFLEEKGLKIYTSLDWNLQQEVEKIIEERAKINENYGAFNASLVALDPKTGEVLSMAGSKDYFADSYPEGCSGPDCLFEPDFNVSMIGKRQPGSAFKPFAYATAFKKGFTPETILWDVETNFGIYGNESYIPQNYNEKFQGAISLRDALAQSVNVPAVKMLYLAGQKDTLETAKKLGITTLEKDPSYYGLSLVLGGGEVKLIDMVSAYGVFATEGLQIPPVFILKIEDSQGNIIEENNKTLKRVLDRQTTKNINDILSDNQARTPTFGPNSALHFNDRQVAGKTGTTQEYKDAWTIGYTPSIVVGVWVGNNNNSPTKKPGVVLAGPIFHRVMEKALLGTEKEYFNEPEVIITSKPILNGEVEEYELPETPHSILYYVDKNNPLGEMPVEPESDSQYSAWEQGIKDYFKVSD